MKLKKSLLFILSLIFVTSCFDDSQINESLKSLENRVAKLEILCQQINSNVSSLQTAISALQSKDFVTATAPIMEGNREIGYTITFTSGKTISIYHGQDGKTPVIGVKADNGVYYWTLDGQWLLDSDGNRIPATGPEGEDAITPKLQIKEGYWYISYDDGKNWNYVGKATGEDGEDGDNFFKSVVETDEAVVMTLADGTVISLPKKQQIDIIFEGIDNSVGILPGETRSIPYHIINGSDNCLVKAFGQNGWRAKVEAESATKGTLIVTPPEELTDDEIIVLVYDGSTTTIMRTISFEEGAIVCDVSTVKVKGGGETVVVDVSSNLAVSAYSSASWIRCTLTPETKAMVPYSLQIEVSKNFSDQERAATVTVSDPSGKVVHTVGIVQDIYDAYENFVDLSHGGETANCYLINSAGQYKFPIIKGNGQKGVIISGDTAELPTAKYAKVVWQDGNLISSVGVNKGFVVFETYDSWKKGNAVVAVTDDNGTILWSWHIWSTDYVLGTNDITVYNHSKSRAYKMMNLTLGEVGNTAPFYQFGRKDPFPKNVTNVSSGGTLAKSIQNPDVFYGNSGYDWCSDSRSDWWDAGYKSYTNSSSTTASVLKGNKTIYDPSPAGYRVPPDDAFTNFTRTGQNTEIESEINSPSPDMYSFWSNSNSYYFYTGNGSSTIRFRAFGGLNASQATYLTNIAYYYAAHPAYTSTGRLMQFYAGVVRPMSTEYSRALAGNIRPIRNEVESEEIYESTDYSKDGTTVTIQRHSKGNGIKILIVGDGFTDQDINSGKYDRSMQQAAEYFFDIEPYKTFRDRFDVINMRVVSPTSVFDETRNTAFETVIGPGSHIEGNLNVAYEKVRQVYGTLDDVLVIVVMNTKKYAGTCWMVGNTISVAFCPMSEEYYYPFDTVIHHEAGGHGFANLGDEYYYSGTIPQSEKEDLIWWQDHYGWYVNVDVTSDKSLINWSNFLSDPLYSLATGIYEGAYGYSNGVWRPTYESCMNSMYGNFNAPSRYAIYKRIMERSGESWSWEDFVEYDSINRASDAKPASGYRLPSPEERPPHARPVPVSPDTLPY